MQSKFVMARAIFILIFLLQLTGSKKITNKSPTSCQRCQILADSFQYWLSKTSRGKHEGGDTAWEEAKLKSYSRSELRLIEIQESLCSEIKSNQDVCYNMAEEAEQLLEKWWLQEDTTEANLFTWLCIESLHTCCPKGHFGEECSLCPHDKRQKVCAGFGTCDGDGTRKGNGTCLCRKGYSGIACEECAKNYYSTSKGHCGPCHESCNDCTGQGARSCVNCNSGWQLESDVCVDVNECFDSVCEPNQYCTNTVGSFYCTYCDQSCASCVGEGNSNCTLCESNRILWVGMCVDNETKLQILSNTYRRLALYIGLLLITFYVNRSSGILASLAVLIIAIYIYFSEKNAKVNTAKVLLSIFDTNQS